MESRPWCLLSKWTEREVTYPVWIGAMFFQALAELKTRFVLEIMGLVSRNVHDCVWPRKRLVGS